LAGTENRIAVERMRYNEAGKAYNIFRNSVPTVLYASWLGFKEEKFFEAPPEAQQVPKVNFGAPAPTRATKESRARARPRRRCGRRLLRRPARRGRARRHPGGARGEPRGVAAGRPGRPAPGGSPPVPGHQGSRRPGPGAAAGPGAGVRQVV